MASIRISFDGSERSVTLEKPEVSIGRDYKADIRLKDAKSSRRHVRIVTSGDGHRLLDSGSANGTLINGAPVREHMLMPGDRIQIGLTTMVYEASAPRRPAALRTAPENRPVPGTAAARRANPLGLVLAGCALLLGLATAWPWLASAKADPRTIEEERGRLRAAGIAKEDERCFDEAIAIYARARALTAQASEMAGKTEEADRWIRMAESARTEVGQIEFAWREFDEAFAAAASKEGAELAPLIGQATDLIKRAADRTFPWLGTVRDRRQALEDRQIGGGGVRDQFFVIRKELTATYKLDAPDVGEYAQGFKAWRAWARQQGADATALVDAELQRLDRGFCVRAAELAAAHAQEVAAGKGRPAAATFLEQAAIRLQGTEGESRLSEELRKYR